VIRRIHHAGIVVEQLKEAYRFYREVLGLPLLREAELADQGVRAALLSAGDTEIELLEPTRGDTGVARFLEKRGEGLHHVCFDTPDVDGDLDDLSRRGVELLDRAPRPGLAGRIAFLHPRACDGVLVELATPPAGHGGIPREHGDESLAQNGHGESVPVRLKRLVIGAHDPVTTTARFHELFGFPEVTINSGPRSMLAVGRGALLIVPAHEVGGSQGIVALSLVADDFVDLMARFDRARVKAMRGTGEVTVAPESSHGVHLHISRYE
jgi:methylmalonyl-CoA/ethylmalonyl-CoA epimerase